MVPTNASEPSTPGTVLVEPDLLLTCSGRLAEVAEALHSDATSVPPLPPEPGFGSGAAAADLEADLLDAVRGHAERLRCTAVAVRAAAVDWREADETAAASFAG